MLTKAVYVSTDIDSVFLSFSPRNTLCALFSQKMGMFTCRLKKFWGIVILWTMLASLVNPQ